MSNALPDLPQSLAIVVLIVVPVSRHVAAVIDRLLAQVRYTGYWFTMVNPDATKSNGYHIRGNQHNGG
jgi:hypothetical protein